MSYVKRKLYGGAISAQIRDDLIDAASFREIPDTQEVYVTKVNDDAIVIDLMELVSETEDSQAIEYHISEISKLNGGLVEDDVLIEKNEVKAFNFPQDKAYTAICLQNAKKWGRDQTKLVSLFGLIRIKKAETDLILSIYLPFKDDKELDDLKSLVDGDSSDNNYAIMRIKPAKEMLDKLLESLKVEDWSLFS